MVFLEKSFELVLSERYGLIIFDLGLILMPTEVNYILEEQGCKKDLFMAFSSSGFQMVFILPIEIEIFYMQVLKV